MSISQKSPQIPLIDYVPAQLHENKYWYISYYVMHPDTEKLKRKIVRINKIKSKKDRRRYGRLMVQQLNFKLHQGWNPFLNDLPRHSMSKIMDAMEHFLRDKRSLRPDSLRAYNSYIKIFSDYISRIDSNIRVISIKKDFAIEFLDHVYFKKKLNDNTYNNYVSFFKLMFTWMIEHNYCKENPFAAIKKKKPVNKTRVMNIEEKQRKKIKQYLVNKNNAFYCVCLLAYNCLLRPKEISYLKIKNIDMQKQIIFIDGSIAKNHNDRITTIPDSIVPYLKKLELNCRQENYIFSKNFTPGRIRLDSREIARYWQHLRETLKLPKQLQFYSLRDSGIIQLLKNGISPKEVMELADHSSLEVTNKYVKYARMEASEVIKKGGTLF